MKILVKTLKGARFEIQVNPEDSVADVKKNVETLMGVTAYPAAEQMLIHKGKVLKDETTLEANNVSENSIIAVMRRKPASTGTPTASATLKPQESSPRRSATTATKTPRLSTELDYLNYERFSESNVEKILEMVRGVWSREAVVYALSEAYNDLDKALEYLYFGFPVQFVYPDITEEDQTQEPEAPEDAALSLRHTPEFEYLRTLALSNPTLLMDVLMMLKAYKPPLFKLIQDNKAVFLRLVLEQPAQELQDDVVLRFQSNEPNNGRDGSNQVGESEETVVEQREEDQTNEPNNEGDGGNQEGKSKETKVEVVTAEDYELIERLEALGFERGDATVAYFICNRNAEKAANILLDDNHESRE